MRLQVVQTGHGLGRKLLLQVIRWMSGFEPADVVKVLFYRPERFGRPFSALVQDALRGPSPWTVGERELFAAVVSARNQCVF